MGTEIERKYLLKSDAWRGQTDGPGVLMRQGYLARGTCTVRVRVCGEEAWITVKGARVGASRPEYEYAIPLEDAARMLDWLCEKPMIEKTRHRVTVARCVFEIDDFHGANAGLVVAEVELTSEEQAVELPEWIGEEVTEDARYYNSNLVRNPYSEWGQG